MCSSDLAIALYGRSMGAATILLYGATDPSIAGLVVDSAFCSLIQLAHELTDQVRAQGYMAPGFLVSLVLRWVRQAVQARAGFDIRTLSPLKAAPTCHIPALFLHGERDIFISPQHTKSLAEAYAGDNEVLVVEGDHNSPRPAHAQHSVSAFLNRALNVPSAWSPAKSIRGDALTLDDSTGHGRSTTSLLGGFVGAFASLQAHACPSWGDDTNASSNSNSSNSSGSGSGVGSLPPPPPPSGPQLATRSSSSSSSAVAAAVTTRASAAAADQEDADLQKAIQMSLDEARDGGALPLPLPPPSSAATAKTKTHSGREGDGLGLASDTPNLADGSLGHTDEQVANIQSSLGDMLSFSRGS